MARAVPGFLSYRQADGEAARLALRQDVTTLGRSATCTLCIALPVVSRLHARISLEHDRYLLADAGSANGTFVNGQRLAQPQHLSTGDQIWLGSDQALLLFHDPEQTLAMERQLSPPPLAIDQAARTVAVYGRPVALSPLEYALLRHLAHNAGAVCTRQDCFGSVWGQPYHPATSEDALNACIAKLRRNLRAAAQAAQQPPPLITAVQRVGLRLDTPVVFGAPLVAAPASAPAHEREA